MTRLGFFLSVVYVLLVVAALSTAVSQKTTSNASISPAGSKCHNVYTSNNFYAGPNKKIETLLHEVKKELREMREEIRSLKENITTGEGVYSLYKLISLFS